MKKIIYLVVVLGLAIILSCAASMDLRMDTLKTDSEYGTIEPKIPFEEFKYFSGTQKPDRPYKEIANLVVQETPTVMMARSAEEMVSYMCKQAWQNGADALINVEISTTNVAGGAARTSAVVKGTAIRYTD